MPADSTEPGMERGDGGGKRPAGWWRVALLIGAILVLFVLALTFDIGAQLKALRGWIDSLGAWGPIVFVGIYVLATIAMVPGTGPTAIAGGLFGSFWGLVCVSLSSTLGAAACFLIARYFARDAVAAWLEGSERFAKLDKLTETHGAWIVAITRLVPVFPFNLLNYGFGLTRVKFWTYVFFSWLCMLPGTAMYVIGTDAIVKAIERGEIPWMLVAIVAGLLVLLMGVGSLARKRLRRMEREAGVAGPEAGDDAQGSEGSSNP